MHPQHAPVAFGQHLEIAARLRRLDDTEAVFLPRHVEIDGVITCDLEEYAAVGTAFIGLPGGMQEPRTEAETRGDLFLRSRIRTRMSCSAAVWRSLRSI